MGAILSRWLVWPALILSVVLWFGVSVVTADAVHTLVKSNFDFARSYGSVSLKTLAGAIIWPLVVGYWMRMATSVDAKSLALGACAVAAWAGVLTVLTAVGIDLLWSFRWAIVVISIASLILEIAVAVWLLRRTTQPLSFGVGFHGSLLSVTTVCVWLMAAKALLLCLSPGVVIRM